MKLLFLCLLGYFVTGSHGAPKAPSFIKPCKPDDDACVLSSGQAAIPYFAKGIPELGVTPMDPLVLDDVKTDEGGFQLSFKKLNVNGPGNCTLTKLSLGPEVSHLDLDAECPITATGQYKAEGKLLFVPIVGEGDLEVKTEKILIKLKAKIETVDGADGKKHWHVADYDYSYEPVERIHYRLDNLFSGDEEKAKPVHVFLNEKWQDVIETIGKPIINEIVEKAKDHIEVFLAAVPADELILA